MRVIRFNYERTHKRRGILITSRWFVVQIYPPILPQFTFWRRHGKI